MLQTMETLVLLAQYYSFAGNILLCSSYLNFFINFLFSQGQINVKANSLMLQNLQEKQIVKKGEVMGKLLDMEEREEFHRVWNFVVPLQKLSSNKHIQAIPPLTKLF